MRLPGHARPNARPGPWLPAWTLAAAVLTIGPFGAHAGDVAYGEYLSSECVTCHQRSGHVTAGVPSIVGWPEDQFIAVMHSYRARDRDNVVMQTIAARLGDDEVAALAAYFARLPGP